MWKRWVVPLTLVSVIVTTLLSIHISEYENACQYRLSLPTPQKSTYPSAQKRLQACKGSVYGFTNFAFVSMITSSGRGAMEELPLYVMGAAKLGVSIKRWSNIDTVMMVVGGRVLPQQNLLVSAGWIICYLDAIENPSSDVSNRFLSAKMYSKLHVWSLVEYEAVVMMDADTLVIRDPTPIFTHVYPSMKTSGALIAADTNTRTAHKNMFGQCFDDQSTFNAGVFVLIPNATLFESLKEGIHILPHIYEWAEQSLLNVYFKDSVYAMPFAYNANLAAILCEPDLWGREYSQLTILHYTVIKPWGYTMNPSTLPENRPIWWRAGYLYALWDMMPIQ